MSESKTVDDLPDKHLQIFLHPYLFEEDVIDMPDYVEIIKPNISGFNRKINSTIKKIEKICTGLNEEHLKYSLLISPIVAFLYSGREIYGILALNPNDDKIHIEIICTNKSDYKYIGTYLLNIVNEIGIQLKKNIISLDSVEQAIPFYEKMGFTKIVNNTTPMIKPIETTKMLSVKNTLSLRRSNRRKSLRTKSLGGGKYNKTKKQRKAYTRNITTNDY